MSNTEERLGRVETHVAVVSTQMDGLDQRLQGINENLRKQTELLQTFVAYQQKQDHLDDRLGKVEVEQDGIKEKLISGMVWLKGSMAAGTLALAIGQALGAYIIKDKVNFLASLGERVTKIEMSVTADKQQKQK